MFIVSFGGAGTEADPYGMTNKRTDNGTSKDNDEIQGSFASL
jgi:hypothetical protein